MTTCLESISVLMHAMKKLHVARDDRQAIAKRSPRSSNITPLGGKVFWGGTRYEVARAGLVH